MDILLIFLIYHIQNQSMLIPHLLQFIVKFLWFLVRQLIFTRPYHFVIMLQQVLYLFNFIQCLEQMSLLWILVLGQSDFDYS